MDERKLLLLIKNHPEVYNPNHKHYRRLEVRRAAWREIALEMNEDEESCNERYINLRFEYQNFVRKLRKFQSKPKGKRPKMMYEKEMIFLWRFIPNKCYNGKPSNVDVEKIDEKRKKKKNEINSSIPPCPELQDYHKKLMRKSKMRKLLTFVGEYPEIYDPSAKHYGNSIRLGIIWNAVGEELQEESWKCVKTWIHLKMEYQYLCILREDGCVVNQLANFTSILDFEEELSFLKPLFDLKNIKKSQTYKLCPDNQKYIKTVPGEVEEYTLLAVVKVYPQLYRSNGDEYLKLSDFGYLTIWKDIARTMKRSVSMCEQTWVILRSLYEEIKNIRKGGNPLREKWDSEDFMDGLWKDDSNTKPLTPQSVEINNIQRGEYPFRDEWDSDNSMDISLKNDSNDSNSKLSTAKPSTPTPKPTGNTDLHSFNNIYQQFLQKKVEISSFKANSMVNTVTEMLIIKYVSDYPRFYRTTANSNVDNTIIWEMMGRQLNISGMLCKQTWEKLRSDFEIHQSDPGKDIFPHYNAMLFLRRDPAHDPDPRECFWLKQQDIIKSLIQHVENYPQLYSNDSNNKSSTDVRWNMVGKELKSSGAECKKLWNALKTCFESYDNDPGKDLFPHYQAMSVLRRRLTDDLDPVQGLYLNKQYIAESLIKHVKSYPQLYRIDTTNISSTDVLWNMIGKHLNCSGVDCKEIWNALKTYFESYDNDPGKEIFPHYQAMSFLRRDPADDPQPVQRFCVTRQSKQNLSNVIKVPNSINLRHDPKKDPPISTCLLLSLIKEVKKFPILYNPALLQCKSPRVLKSLRKNIYLWIANKLTCSTGFVENTWTTIKLSYRLYLQDYESKTKNEIKEFITPLKDELTFLQKFKNYLVSNQRASSQTNSTSSRESSNSSPVQQSSNSSTVQQSSNSSPVQQSSSRSPVQQSSNSSPVQHFEIVTSSTQNQDNKEGILVDLKDESNNDVPNDSVAVSPSSKGLQEVTAIDIAGTPLQINRVNMLIFMAIVKKYPVIYDPNHKFFHSRLDRLNAWTRISSELNCTLYECDLMWNEVVQKFLKYKEVDPKFKLPINSKFWRDMIDMYMTKNNTKDDEILKDRLRCTEFEFDPEVHTKGGNIEDSFFSFARAVETLPEQIQETLITKIKYVTMKVAEKYNDSKEVICLD